MERIEIFKIQKATSAILSDPEIKKSLDFLQIYSISKINKRATNVGKETNEKQKDLVAAFDAAGKSEEAKIAFNSDMESLMNEGVGFDVAKVIPENKAEKTLQLLSGEDTMTAINYLIDLKD